MELVKQGIEEEALCDDEWLAWVYVHGGQLHLEMVKATRREDVNFMMGTWILAGKSRVSHRLR